MNYLLEIIKRKKFSTAMFVFACLFPVLNSFLFNYILGEMVDVIEQNDMNLLKHNLKVGFIIIGITGFIYSLSRIIRVSLIRSVVIDLRNLIFSKINNLRYDKFLTIKKSTLLSYLVNDVNMFEEKFFRRITSFIYHSSLAILTIIILINYDIKLSLILLVISSFLFMIMKYYKSIIETKYENIMFQNKCVANILLDTFEGAQLINNSEIRKRKLDECISAVELLEEDKRKYELALNIQNRIAGLFGLIGLVWLLLYVIKTGSTNSSGWSIGFILVTINTFIWSIKYIVPGYSEIKASLKFFDIFSEMDDVRDSKLVESKTFDIDNGIRLKDFSFYFKDKCIFKDINLTIENGDKCLIIGDSGVGKSTFLQLLAKGYSEYEGEIMYGESELRSIKSNNFYSNVSILSQEVYLFNDTVENNLCLYKEYSDEKKKRVIDSLKLKEIVARNYVEDHGCNFSAGERQRISLGRTLIKSCDVLFLDEATSNLQVDLAFDIEKEILTLPCTVINVSHRIHSELIKNYDKIIEISNNDLNLLDVKLFNNERSLDFEH